MRPERERRASECGKVAGPHAASPTRSSVRVISPSARRPSQRGNVPARCQAVMEEAVERWFLIALLVLVAALAATAVYAVAQAHAAERKTPPIGHFLDVDGVRLHYFERGQGDPVVLIHGNGALIQDFIVSGLVDGLSERHRVIVFDRPGFGYSTRPRTRIWTPMAQADVLRKALDQLGVEQAIVLGHSWGTLVAVALALQAPDLVRGLVLLSGYYFPTARLDVPLLSRLRSRLSGT